MLKHATISRTSRAQQTLQLQRHINTSLATTVALSPDQPTPSPVDLASGPALGHPSSPMGASDAVSLAPAPSPAPSLSSESSRCASLLGSPSKWQPANAAGVSHRPQAMATTHAPGQHQGSTIKVHAQTLGQQVEYITLHVHAQTKSQQIIKSLLKKFRLKHRDPNLFYLTLERWIRKDGLKFKSIMVLGDEACPLQLQQCCSNPPHNDIKFTLQIRAGVLVKIFCSDVLADARYKCLSLSTQTTVEETIELMLHCLSLIPHLPSSGESRRPGCSPAGSTHSSSSSSSSASSSASSNGDTSSSSASISSSSGIESDPTTCGGNFLRVHADQTEDHDDGPATGVHSRANSFTSISSRSNSSTAQTPATVASVVEQYCMVIECRDSNYRRVLRHDEYLVDVYQNLVTEAQQQQHPQQEQQHDSLDRQMQAHSPNDLINPQPDQWFFIKLKRREDLHHEAIKFANPRLNMPLPPIPLSLSLANSPNGLGHGLERVVSTTRIELNNSRHTSSPSLPVAPGNHNNNNHYHHQQQQQQQQRSTAQSSLDGTQSELGVYPMPAPPQFIVLGPPVKPRVRNLSNASSTFGRPLTTTINRRRAYDPGQLAEDLSRLDTTSVVGESSAVATTTSASPQADLLAWRPRPAGH